MNDWVWAALTPTSSTFRAANRFSEVPACSNRVKNTTAPRIRTVASIIRCRSTQVLAMKAMIRAMPMNEATVEMPRAMPTMALR